MDLNFLKHVFTNPDRYMNTIKEKIYVIKYFNLVPEKIMTHYIYHLDPANR